MRIKALWRLLWALGHIARGMWTIVILFPKLRQFEKEARVHAWAQAMLEGVGIVLAIKGIPVASGPALLVANHLSWLDIVPCTWNGNRSVTPIGWCTIWSKACGLERCSLYSPKARLAMAFISNHFTPICFRLRFLQTFRCNRWRCVLLIQAPGKRVLLRAISMTIQSLCRSGKLCA